MLCLVRTTDAICYIYHQVLNLVYRLPEDGSDVPKHVEAMQDHTLKCVSKMSIKLVL